MSDIKDIPPSVEEAIRDAARKYWPDDAHFMEGIRPAISAAIEAAETASRIQCLKECACRECIGVLPLADGSGALSLALEAARKQAQQEMRDSGFQHPDDVAKMILSATEAARREERAKTMQEWLDFAGRRGWDGAIAITQRDLWAIRKGGTDAA